MTTMARPLAALVAVITVTGAGSVGAILDDGRASTATGFDERVLAEASGHLEERSQTVEDPAQQARLTVEQQNLATAQALLSELEASDRPELETAIALAKIGLDHQATQQGIGDPTPVALPDHASPSEALAELADRHGAALGLEDLDALDAHPAADELTRVVEAFLALETATREITTPTGADADLALGEANAIDRSAVFTARGHLLDAIVDLEAALDDGDVVTGAANEPTLAVPPAFAVDLDGTDTLYEEKVALSIDIGGDDAYHNNAGGSRVFDGTCAHFDTEHHWGAGALIDLGAGADTYGDPDDPNRCGSNGGAHSLRATGFLLDDGGGDLYTAGRSGGNGGGAGLGMGFLLDVAGDDTYDADSGGMNGGADSGGLGFLLDADGSDTYRGWYAGVNGGGGGDAGFFGPILTSSGFLFDAAGDDTYIGNDNAINGGAEGRADKGLGGQGFLMDAAGDDTYRADDYGTNGAGHVGAGFLFDVEGHDTYTAGDHGVNGGGVVGVGLLIDEAGDDTYSAGNFGFAGVNGVNGGAGDDPRGPPPAVPLLGVGLLYDAGGTDTYEDAQGGTGTDKTVVPKGTLGAQIDGASSPGDPGAP